MKLYQLLFGKNKKKMRVIMVDSKERCEAYKKAREATKNSKSGKGWHKIEEAPSGTDVWKQKNCTIKGNGNKTNSGPSIVGKGPSGYISNNGFNPNT